MRALPPHPLPLLALLLGCQIPMDTGDSADTGDTADTAADSADTDPTDTGEHTGDTADTGAIDTADTGAVDTADTADTADTDSAGGTGGISGGDSSLDTADTAEPDTGTIRPSGPILIYAVRHAEKESDGEDPGLTEEGLARAEALAVLMHDEPLVAIYASELLRTQETVQPTADDHGLPVITDIDPEADLAEHILLNHGDDTVLHAGHSYTLPTLFESLGVTELPEDYDYGDLWIIEIDTDGAVTIEESHYGE